MPPPPCDVHSPASNIDEDVVSSPNLRSLATTEQRALARTKQAAKPKPFADDDGFDLTLSLDLVIPTKKATAANVEQLKDSLVKLFNLALKDYDKDGTEVLGLELANEDGDGRELQAIETIFLVLKLTNKFCNRPAVTTDCTGVLCQETCYCIAAKEIVALLNLFSAELANIAQ